jgi:hypothetical protein
MAWLSIVLTSLVGFQAMAATPFKRALTMKMNSYLTDGVVVGGVASSGASILGARRIYSAKAKIERLILDLGDREAKPSAGRIGFFQASVDSKQNRVELDVAQLHICNVTETQLKNLFKNSPYVADVQLTMDPEDKTGTLVLKLKRPMQLEVFEMMDKKKPSRVVLDLRPAPATEMRSHI